MEKIRVVLLTNYFWGSSLISDMVEGLCSPYVEVVGVATDKVSAEKQHLYDLSFESLSNLGPDERRKKLHGRIWNEFFCLRKRVL
mgnify:CR=1 FL=1|jgi:hypothetical protein